MQRKIAFVLAVMSVCTILMSTGCDVLGWLGGFDNRHNFLP